MLGKKLRQVPSNKSGVYCLYDLDMNPAYVGRSSDLRGRLRQHFIRQDSSVVSYGRLDIWDISCVEWWQINHDKQAEQQLLAQHDPYLNLENEVAKDGVEINVDPENPDGTVYLISEEEREFRSQPYNRVKQKLEHLSRMVDKIKLAGHSDDTKRTFYEHQDILAENIATFLDLEDEQST